MKTLPEGFEQMLRSTLGDAQGESLIASLREDEAVVSVRCNRRKGAQPTPEAERVPWEPSGLYLPERPLFAADPAWHQGRYYVQDASSMILGEVVRRITAQYPDMSRPLRYLDSCAAPGGKSIAALDALPEGSFLVANEFDGQRANILTENLARYGAAEIAITRGDTRHLAKLGQQFDIVGADVPCSGEGMMRKEEAAVRQWSPALVEQCAELQREIVHNVWQTLKPGGFLIYSTCTFNTSENEDNVAHFMEEYGAESIDLGLEEFEGVVKGLREGIHAYRFLPGRVRGEGLFMAVLKKPGEYSQKDERQPKMPKENPNFRKFAHTYLRDDKRFALFGTSRIEARPMAHLALCNLLENHPSALRIGLPIAELKGKDLAPTHELALSTDLNRDIPAAELAYGDAMAYLHREAITLPQEQPLGYVAVTYGGTPLGWVKNIGRRSNNQLPDYLRLRLDLRNIPSESPQLPIIYS